MALHALVGHTGFVGGVLAGQHRFDAAFNSRTMDESAGQRFDLLVCAAAPGSMFDANRRPDEDRDRIDRLIAQLDRIAADRVVLVSTIACLAGFAADNEDSEAFEQTTPYGANRRRLEAFVASRFAGSLVVRLPALFGPGLKKNFLFDLMNPMPSMLGPADLARLAEAVGGPLADALAGLYPFSEAAGLHVIDRAALAALPQRAALEEATAAAGLAAIRFTNPDSRFQFYAMRRLWADIALGLERGLPTLHLAPPPLRAGDVFARIAGRPMPQTAARLHAEDMRTRHGALWGQDGPYISRPEPVLEDVAGFVASRGEDA